VPREFECPLCRWHGHPSFELVDDPSSPMGGKLAAKCGKVGCTYTDPNKTPAYFNQGVAVDKEGANPVLVQTSADAPPPPPRQAPRSMAHASPRAPAFDVGEPPDVIGLMRRRRDYLEMEVARLEAAKTELRKLNKMIAVADREQAKIDVENSARALVDREITTMGHVGDAE